MGLGLASSINFSRLRKMGAAPPWLVPGELGQVDSSLECGNLIKKVITRMSSALTGLPLEGTSESFAVCRNQPTLGRAVSPGLGRSQMSKHQHTEK